MLENVGRLLKTHLVLFVVLRDEELESLADQAPAVAARAEALFRTMPQQADLPVVLNDITAAARDSGISPDGILAISPARTTMRPTRARIRAPHIRAREERVRSAVSRAVDAMVIVTVICVELFTTVEKVTSPLFGSNRTLAPDRKLVPVRTSGTLMAPDP